VTSNPGRRPRIVSLVPSATETLLALGADVVACTRFCNQSLPTVGGTKNPDVDAIVALTPDVVVVDTEENRREDAEALEKAGLELVVTSVRSVDDALAVVDTLAGASATAAPTLRVGANHRYTRMRAFVPIWRRPWMTVNGATYGASLLGSIAVDLVTADLSTEYPYSFADAHIAELRDAFPASRIMRVDGEDLFWWGIRTPDAQRRLAQQIGGTATSRA
jgi:ABC-type hemin transport system substrate-binding protein